MIVNVTCTQRTIGGEIVLPASKSISNRALIINAIGNLKGVISNLSAADDTIQLQKALANKLKFIDAGDGGTTVRFLLAYFAFCGDEIVLTGSDTIKKRPIGELVDALRNLGAAISYVEAEGSLPVKISPSVFTQNQVALSGEISSQFVSALMMIGPYLPNGLVIEITGEVLSLPYILMTKTLMEYYGAEVYFESNIVTIKKGNYVARDLDVEPDWSAASYWYELVALSDDAKIFLPKLKQNSLQGDSVIAAMMHKLGVQTTFSNEGATLTKQKNFKLPDYFTHDFADCPDLAPAVAATCGALNITADLTGLKNFRLKESDRAAAMQRELYNMNVKTDFCGGSKFKVYPSSGITSSRKAINTYNDHRIAMAFAPLAIKTGSVMIENYGVVTKSYPSFWEDLNLVGLKINKER